MIIQLPNGWNEPKETKRKVISILCKAEPYSKTLMMENITTSESKFKDIINKKTNVMASYFHKTNPNCKRNLNCIDYTSALMQKTLENIY